MSFGDYFLSLRLRIVRLSETISVGSSSGLAFSLEGKFLDETALVTSTGVSLSGLPVEVLVGISSEPQSECVGFMYFMDRVSDYETSTIMRDFAALELRIAPDLAAAIRQKFAKENITQAHLSVDVEGIKPSPSRSMPDEWDRELSPKLKVTGVRFQFRFDLEPSPFDDFK